MQLNYFRKESQIMWDYIYNWIKEINEKFWLYAQKYQKWPYLIMYPLIYIINNGFKFIN